MGLGPLAVRFQLIAEENENKILTSDVATQNLANRINFEVTVTFSSNLDMFINKFHVWQVFLPNFDTIDEKFHSDIEVFHKYITKVKVSHQYKQC